MRILVQRVSQASVTVDDEIVGEIGRGLLLFGGVTHGDDAARADALAAKVANLRLFDDDTGQLNRSALDVLNDGEDVGILVVSQFTLYGETRKGRRPSFAAAAPADVAAPLVDHVGAALRGFGLPVAEGRFGAEMAVALVNDGPVTLWLDSDDFQRPRRPAREERAP
ncbi:MAG: D-tyrosyl-tRNA(Tyr) deacylase [Chloroflexia bacterium]|nr:D-tyrosyl-tRNA(Tyr) deacylase [Chloroflexia bacterium]